MTFNTNFPMPFEKDNEYNALGEIDENTNDILFSFDRSNSAYTTGPYLGSTSVLTTSPVHFDSLGGPDGTHWLEIQADPISASPSPSTSASTPHNYHSVPASRALPNFLATPVLDLPDEGNEIGSTKGPRPNVALSLHEVGNQ